MSVWYRVFATSAASPDLDVLAHTLASECPGLRLAIDGERDRWRRLEMLISEHDPLLVERFLRDDEGVRAELQAWAAWLETQEHNPHHAELMQHMTSTQQVFILECAEDEGQTRLAERLCQALAAATAGVYQVDGRGICGEDGGLLVAEEESHPDDH